MPDGCLVASSLKICPTPKASWVACVQQALLSWYKKKSRPLPWRQSQDPYRIWLSEVMLQQTQVITVIPYYHKFLQSFPTVHALASASEEEVLKGWEGLGYYRRARQLHAAAKQVVTNYGGSLPQSSEQLRKLPGFGPYTCAAVASIAFNEAIIAVDGNVRRVMARLLASNQNLEQQAQTLRYPDQPGQMVQALMELGALVCLAKKPKCDLCPLTLNCSAYQKSQQHLFPKQIQQVEIKQIHAHVGIIYSGKHFLLRPRTERGPWYGLWEFPTFEHEQKLSALMVERQFSSDLSELKLSAATKLSSFNHQLTHRVYKVTVYAMRASKKAATKGLWLTTQDVGKKPLSRLQQKAWQLFTRSLEAPISED